MVYLPTEDGRWVNENFMRLAELINEYDQTLELRWIPPDKRSRDDKKPYMVVDTRTNQPVLFASELDNPVEILGRLFEADNKNGNVLDRLEAHNKAIEAFKNKKRIEEIEEALESAEFLFKSPLNFIRMNGKKYDDQRRIIGTSHGRKFL